MNLPLRVHDMAALKGMAIGLILLFFFLLFLPSQVTVL